MKILQPQSAVLSNYEALSHVKLVRSQLRSNPQKHENVETILKEVTDYLSSSSSTSTSAANAQTKDESIQQQQQSNNSPLPPYHAPYYTPVKITDLVKRLSPYVSSSTNPKGLYKHEVLTLLNLRPRDLSVLDCVVEECDERFSEGEQLAILKIVGEVLGGDGHGDGT